VLSVGWCGYALCVGDVVLDVGLGHGPRDEQEEEAMAHKPTQEDRGKGREGRVSASNVASRVLGEGRAGIART
jgi:hypothetical protein